MDSLYCGTDFPSSNMINWLKDQQCSIDHLIPNKDGDSSNQTNTGTPTGTTTQKQNNTPVVQEIFTTSMGKSKKTEKSISNIRWSSRKSLLGFFVGFIECLVTIVEFFVLRTYAQNIEKLIYRQFSSDDINPPLLLSILLPFLSTAAIIFILSYQWALSFGISLKEFFFHIGAYPFRRTTVNASYHEFTVSHHWNFVFYFILFYLLDFAFMFSLQAIFTKQLYSLDNIIKESHESSYPSAISITLQSLSQTPSDNTSLFNYTNWISIKTLWGALFADFKFLFSLQPSQFNRVINIPQFINLVFLTPILEEFICRGLLTCLLNRRFMFALGNSFFVALQFSLLHLLNIGTYSLTYVILQCILAIIVGYTFSLIDYLTSSLYPSILLHIVNNFVSVWWSTSVEINLNAPHILFPLLQTFLVNATVTVLLIVRVDSIAAKARSLLIQFFQKQKIE